VFIESHCYELYFLFMNSKLLQKVLIYFSRLTYLLIVISFMLSAVNIINAQHLHQEAEGAKIISFIDQAVSQGTITYEEGILQKLYAGFKPELLDPKFKSEKDYFIYCLTPVVLDYFFKREQISQSSIDKIAELLPSASHEHLIHISESGNFQISYRVDGTESVPLEDSNKSGVPDYIEMISFAADSSYHHLVNNLGYTDFVLDEPYEIRVQLLSFATAAVIPVDIGQSYVIMSNSIDNPPPNNHPDGNLKGTIYSVVAHELKHSSQFSAQTKRFLENKFDLGTDWLEMDATLAENVVFPDTDFYHRLLRSLDDPSTPSERTIFGSPESPTPVAYHHVTWMKYFQEQYGENFWVGVWNLIEQQGLNFLSATENALSKRATKLENNNLLNHLWHLASGEFNHPEFGFSASEQYPTPKLRQIFTHYPEETDSQLNFINPLAAHYYSINAINDSENQAVLNFTTQSNASELGIGIIGYLKDGSIRTRTYFYSNPDQSIQIQSGWKLNELHSIKFAVVNGSQSDSYSYGLSVDQFSQDIFTENADFKVYQNYPNPFNPVTNIEFELFETSNIKVEIYDISGRLITTIVDQVLLPSYYSYSFDASNLSSGQYFYRIQTDRSQEVRKMTVIK
jgi:hypothetical protein